MKTAVVGYPRIGNLRELKFATEKYLSGNLSREDLQTIASALRETHWSVQHNHQIDFISSNDFSFYDAMLDTAILLNAVPKCYRQLHLDPLDEYFAMARGYQGETGDVKALAMKKWFNTNYHYMVPEIEDDTKISLIGTKPFDEYLHAYNLGITTKPVLIGAFTFLKLAKFTGKKRAKDFVSDVTEAYCHMIERFTELGAQWIQFDEPALVFDLSNEEITLFNGIYSKILAAKGCTNVHLQTYFGDIRDCYQNVTALPFDGIGLDFVEGKKTLELVETLGFPEDKTLFAGIVNGKNKTFGTPLPSSEAR